MSSVSHRRIQRMRRFMALALIACFALVVNPVGAMPMSMVLAPSTSASDGVAVASAEGHAMHCHDADSAPAKVKSCCGDAGHPCSGGHCCGCVAASGGAVLPSAVPDLRYRAPADAPSRRLYAIAIAMRWAPPLRPPAA